MDEKRYNEYHESIKEMMTRLGEDGTDDYLLENLTHTMRDVEALRKKLKW